MKIHEKNGDLFAVARRQNGSAIIVWHRGHDDATNSCRSTVERWDIPVGEAAATLLSWWRRAKKPCVLGREVALW